MSGDSSKAFYARWGIPAGSIVIILAAIATQPLSALLVAAFPVILGWSPSRAEEWFLHSPVANFVTIFLFELLSVLIIVAFTAYRKVSFWIAVALQRIHWRDTLYAFVGFLAYLGMAMVVLTVLPLLVAIDPNQEQAIGFETNSGGMALALAFVGLVVLPPVAEEIVFRGFFYGTLRSNKVNVAWSTVMTSLIFASLHLFGAAEGGLLWIAFADTFVLSLVLCYVREQTGNLWASIFIHILKNGLVFINLFIIKAV